MSQFRIDYIVLPSKRAAGRPDWHGMLINADDMGEAVGSFWRAIKKTSGAEIRRVTGNGKTVLAWDGTT